MVKLKPLPQMKPNKTILKVGQEVKVNLNCINDYDNYVTKGIVTEILDKAISIKIEEMGWQFIYHNVGNDHHRYGTNKKYNCRWFL